MNKYKNKCLIVSGGGYLGTALVNCILQEKRSDNVIATYRKNKCRIEDTRIENIYLDFCDDESVDEFIKNIDYVSTAIFAATSEMEDSYEIASVNIERILKHLKSINCRIIYMSSNAVFDGSRGNHNEEDIPNAIKHYGISKYNSEKIVNGLQCNSVIVRTSYLYGNNGVQIDSRTKELMERLEKEETIERFSNMFINSSNVMELAQKVVKIAYSDYTGIIHAAGEKMSAYEFFKLSLKEQGINCDNRIIPVQVPQHMMDKVLLDSSLDCSKYNEYFK